MIYIYDILVNFNRSELYDFYEWNSEDEIINIKKIKLIRINSDTLDDLLNYNCVVDNDILIKINSTCELYNKYKNKLYNYTCLLSDGNRVIAFNFDKEGNTIFRSKLLLDEEEEIATLVSNLDIYDIKYKKIKKVKERNFLTRKESIIYNYLLNEIKSSYNEKEYSKLKYLYQEYFDKDSDSKINMCNELLDSLKNINTRHKEIYELLIQTKKQV